MNNMFFKSQYFRDLAHGKRTLASRMADPMAKASMIRLSNHYAELAKQAEGSIDKVADLLTLHPSFPEALVLVIEH
jgi:predicted Zn-dependent protease